MGMKIRISIGVLAMGLFIAGQAQAAFFKGLGDTPGGLGSESAYGMSADGTVVVGCGEGLFTDEAFRWTLKGGMEGLGYLPGHDISCALDISSDGSVIVGYSASGTEREAFRWTQAGGMQGLGDLPSGDLRSKAHAVSDDGQVVVGTGQTAAGSEAFIWVRGSLSHLQTLLTDSFGLVLSGWTLTAATLVSADGNTIAGYGINPDGENEAWIAHIGAKTGAPALAPPTGLRIVTQ